MGSLVFQAWDEDDLNGTPLATLTTPSEKSVLMELYGVGAGEFNISRHSSEVEHCRPGRYITVHLDSDANPARFGFFVTESQNVVLSENEEGAEVFHRSGEGAMSVLADAIVWYKAVTDRDSAVPTADSEWWQWTAAMNAHPAGVMVRMLEEAQERGCFPFLTYDFDRDEDSDGNPWTVALGDFRLDIGTDLLTVADKLTKLGLVFVMDPDFTLHCYETEPTRRGAPSFGTDLSASISFTAAVNIATAAGQQQQASPAKSTVLVKGTRGDNGMTAWVEANSAAGLAEVKRRKEGLLDLGDATGFAQLQTAGLESIYSKLRLRDGASYLGVYDTGNVPFTDYNLGDTVEVDVPGVWDEEQRVIMSLGFVDTASGEYDVIVGFDQTPGYTSKGGSIVQPTRPARPLPPGSDADMGDRAADGSMVALSSGGSAAFVQKASVNIDDDTITLASPPTVGNLLVLWVTVRSTSSTFTPPTGFTQIEGTVTSSSDSFVQRKAGMAYRFVQLGDSDTVDIGSTFGAGTNAMGSLAEFSGVGLPDDTAALSNQTQNVTTTCGGAVTPTSATETLLVGGAVIGGTNSSSGGDGATALTPGASITELHDLRNNNNASPRLWNGYRIAATPSGSYSITATQDDATARVWGGITASFPSGEQSWSLPTPNVNDGDDATYQLITGTDLLRVDLGVAARIVRTRIRIATTNAGSRTFTIKGANSSDFSDEATLTTIAFTATGGLTAQDVTGQWINTTAYRYYELSIGTSDTFRVHAWELYEATPGAIIVEDPTNGGAPDDLQDVLDNIYDEAGVTDHGGLTGLSDDDHPQYVRATDGGGEVISAVASSGTTETLNLANGNVHDVTLTDDCTFTFTSPAAGRARSFTLFLRQGASPPHLATWPGSVVWASGSAPTLASALNAVNVLTFVTLDGGTVWYGFSSVGELDDLTDVTITSPVETDRLRYDGSGWVNSALAWVPVMTYDGTNWLVAVDGSGNAIMTEA